MTRININIFKALDIYFHVARLKSNHNFESH